jgi:ketosteroid isomerase-like protein
MADAERATGRSGHAAVDNVAIVERAFGAFARRDLKTFLELADPEIQLFTPGTAALAQGGRSYRRHDGLVRYFHDVARVWDELEVIPQRYRERGQFVVVTGRLRARREGSFLIDEPAQWVFEIRGGKVLRARAYTNRDAALTAAGLSE